MSYPDSLKILGYGLVKESFPHLKFSTIYPKCVQKGACKTKLDMSLVNESLPNRKIPPLYPTSFVIPNLEINQNIKDFSTPFETHFLILCRILVIQHDLSLVRESTLMRQKNRNLRTCAASERGSIVFTPRRIAVSRDAEKPTRENYITASLLTARNYITLQPTQRIQQSNFCNTSRVITNTAHSWTHDSFWSCILLLRSQVIPLVPPHVRYTKYNSSSSSGVKQSCEQSRLYHSCRIYTAF